MFEKKQEEVPQQPVITVDALKEFARELKAPTQEEAEKAALLKAQKQAKKEAFLAERREADRITRLKYFNCIDGSRHHKQHPYADQHTINGQLNSDNLIHPLCIKCHVEFPPFKPEFLAGNDLRDVANLTVDLIEMWAKNSGTDVSEYRRDYLVEKKEAVTA